MQEKEELTGFEGIEILNREDLLRMLTKLVFKMKNKIFYGRFTKPEIEKLRIRYDHLFLEFVRTYNSVLRDAELEELRKRVEELERRLI